MSLLFELEEHTLLSEKNFKIHNLCVILFEQLQEIITSSLYDDFTRTNFSLEGIPNVPDNLDTEQLLELLTQNNRKNEVVDILTKHITFSVLKDFLQFIYESLNAVRNTRFSVAYTLIRKPFVDELLLFEQLLADKTDFINRYYFQNDVRLYDPGNRKLTDADRRNIITNAVNKLKYPSDFSVDTLFDYRYEKSAKYGMNWVSNHALHIVTTDSNYKTLDKNLNFVFSVKDDYEGYWNHYYSIVLYLLFYTSTIIDEIVFEFLPDQKHRKYIKATKRTIISTYQNAILSEDTERLEEMTDILSRDLEHTCQACGSITDFGNDWFQGFVLTDELLCEKCGTNQFTDPKFQDKFLNLG